MAKNSIFSTSGEYKSKYYSRCVKSWSGKTAHNKIKRIMDELADSDKDKLRDYLEDMGENYEKPDKWEMYKVVRDIEDQVPIDQALKPHYTKPNISKDDIPLSPF